MLSGLTQGTDYSDVKRFNATTQTWESYASSQFTQFEPGKGYNIIGLRSCSFSYGKSETTTTFVYDSAGQRVKKTVGGTTTTTYLGKDYDVTGSLNTKYIYLGDTRISTKDSSGTLQFIHDDHIGSANVVTDSSGNQAGYLEYDPYGSTVTQTGSADPKHKFTGQELDTTHLYYYGARYYDPQIGRFITPDSYVQQPSNPQTLNRYSYVKNNPIKYTDPTGNFAFLAFLGYLFIGTLAVAGAAAVTSVIARMAGNDRLARQAMQVEQDALIVSAAVLAVAAVVVSAAEFVAMAAPHVAAATVTSGSYLTASQAELSTTGYYFAAPSATASAAAGNILAGSTVAIAGAAVTNEIINTTTVKSKAASIHFAQGAQNPESSRQENETQAPNAEDLEYHPDNSPLSGGRGGEDVKDLKGPPNSAVPGNNTKNGKPRAFVTNEAGEVIRDITPDRAKPVTPGKGFGPKEIPISQNDKEILKRLFGDGS